MPNYYVSTTGNDANDGLTWATAFGKVSKATSVWNALAAAQQGGSIITVAPGVYGSEPQILIQPKINSSGWLIVQSQYPGGAVVKCNPTSANYCVYIYSNGNTGNVNSPYCGVVFRGFEVIDNTPGNTCTVGIGIATPNCWVDQCYVHNIGNANAGGSGGGGIDNTGYGDGVTSFGCLVTRCKVINIGPQAAGSQAHGIYLSSAYAAALNNICGYQVAGNGINGRHNGTNLTIIGNTVFNCNVGIFVGSDTAAVTGCLIANNIIINNATYGVRDNATNPGTVANTSVDHNVIAGNTTAATLMQGSGSTVTNTVTTAPTFVNYQANGTGDYHLAAASSAIAAGLLTEPGEPVSDYDGRQRPILTAPSCGAYEYNYVPLPVILRGHGL